MGGGLMQLVAYGAQDIYLTGNPQITFFKVVYRRHTNFSMEAIAQSFNGTANVPVTNITNTASATISRNGDLIHKMYVVVEGAIGINLGSSLVDEAELEIGGQKIDKHWADWNKVWNELSTTESKAIGLKSMQGDIGSTGSTGVGMVQVPLNFWFCRNPGLALPLIALQYHEVKVQLTLKRPSVLDSQITTPSTAKLFVDYIYLDTDERRRFAQVSHEYLIEQLQRQAISTDTSQKLVFNHPVKELIWTTPTASYNGAAPLDDYGTAQLKLNGHDRFSKQQEEYFRLRQPFDYHTSIPRQNLPSAARTTIALTGTGDIATGQLYSGAVTNDLITATVGGTVYTVPSGGNDFLPVATKAGLTATTIVGQTVMITVAVTDGTNGITTHAVGSHLFGVVKSISANTDVLTFESAPVDSAGASMLDGASLDFVQATQDSFVLSVVKDSVLTEARTSRDNQLISVYSFALKPEEHQPSGTCNFSRIDTAILEFGNAPNVAGGYVYAVNYNVLRIMSGMGGLAYSN